MANDNNNDNNNDKKSGYGVKYLTRELIKARGKNKEISKIKELDLSFNCDDQRQIIKLENLEKCQSLQSLIIQRQALNKMVGIEKLHNLIELDLSGNHIKKIESIKTLKSLKKLDLSFNSIINIPPSMSYLSQLISLNISNNNLQNVCFILKYISYHIFMYKNPSISMFLI